MEKEKSIDSIIIGLFMAELSGLCATFSSFISNEDIEKCLEFLLIEGRKIKNGEKPNEKVVDKFMKNFEKK